ncbi:MAG: glycosyltransferase family 9 protein [Micavibrio sp.]|nr:glycosyltransferase family 9 protein [Micavibrio sp.]
MAQGSILVIKQGSVSDFTLALGAMAAIRRHHAGAHITLLTGQAYVDAAQRSGYFNSIIVDARTGIFDVAGLLRLYRALHAAPFTHVYDLRAGQGNRSYLRLLKRQPDNIVRMDGIQSDRHISDRYSDLLRPLGMAVNLPDLSWMASDISFFGLETPYVLLVPGSSPVQPEKRWPAMRYGALGLKLLREGYDVAVLGTSAEHDVIARVVKSCPGIHDLSGRTSLYDIATLARGAAAAVGNDAGPTHIIALSNCPVIALFSAASDPALGAPRGDAVTVIQADDLADISVDDVYKNLKPRQEP